MIWHLTNYVLCDIINNTKFKIHNTAFCLFKKLFIYKQIGWNYLWWIYWKKRSFMQRSCIKERYVSFTGTPFILHPMEVAQILSTMTSDLELMTAGILNKRSVLFLYRARWRRPHSRRKLYGIFLWDCQWILWPVFEILSEYGKRK